MTNGTMLQVFEWDLPADGRLWKTIARRAFHFRKLGFTALWLPPAYKGNGGVNDVGYGVYDLYDLGEFDQKGTVATKYGDKDSYLNAIKMLHRAGLQALADVVLNHRMGADVDTDNPAVRKELSNWGHWYIDITGLDGFRLDAVKHIGASFYRDWLKDMRTYAQRELFAVGEYWQDDPLVLKSYLESVEGEMSLFDVPLHAHFNQISHGNGGFDMSKLLEGTLVSMETDKAVTFVDNHDTQPGQSLESWVDGWFKAAAYGIILLRRLGYPCVFYGDLYGIPSRGIGAVSELPVLLYLRRYNAFGEEHDYFDHTEVVGFTREGLREEPGSGLAFLCSDGAGGEKRMFVGSYWAGSVFRCAVGKQPDVIIDQEGCGLFKVNGGGASVYVPRMHLGDFLNRKLTETREWLEELFRKQKAMAVH